MKRICQSQHIRPEGFARMSLYPGNHLIITPITIGELHRCLSCSLGAKFTGSLKENNVMICCQSGMQLLQELFTTKKQWIALMRHVPDRRQVTGKVELLEDGVLHRLRKSRRLGWFGPFMTYSCQ